MSEIFEFFPELPGDHLNSIEEKLRQEQEMQEHELNRRHDPDLVKEGGAYIKNKTPHNISDMQIESQFSTLIPK